MQRLGGRAATWTFVASTWRARWRSLLVLTLMIALTGGAILLTVAGARRSATALERFDDEARTLDVFVIPDLATPEPPAFEALLDGPLVESVNDVAWLFVDLDTDGAVFGAMSQRGLDVERGVLLDGRRADPDQPDEVVLTDVAAEEYGLGVGDTFEFGSITQEQADELVRTGQEPTSLDGPRLLLRVVGIVRNGFTLAGSDAGRITITTPAFMEKYGDQIGRGPTSHMVRLADTPGAIDEFTDAVTAAYGDEHRPSVNVGQGEESVDDSIRVVTAALIAVGLVVAIAGVTWVVAGVARHQRGASTDIDVLRALGSSPGQRRALLVGMVAPALVFGPVAAIAVAAGLSPLFPVGTARRLDPDPGLHADWTVLVAGAAVLGIVIALATAIWAARLVDVSSRAATVAPRVPRAVDRAARTLPPAPGTGVRFALHGRRRLAAPVRPALAGAVIGVVGLVAVAVVGSSMQRLVDTPARWGTTWDAAIEEPPPQLAEMFESALAPEDVLDDADIDAAAVLLYDEQVTINGVEAISMTLDPLKGDLAPAVVDGRAPRGPDEIALGRNTLDAVGVPLGSTVTVGSRAGAAEPFRVVGAIAFPSVSSPTAVANGAALTAEGGDRLLLGDPSRGTDVGTPYIVVRWASGIDEEAALARLAGAGPPPLLPTPPPEIEGLRDVRGFPLVAAGALVVLGVIATIHALVLTVRRRRHELGVLSALGFTPSMRATVVTAQATTLACAALVVGIPLGLLVGRATWLVIAEEMGLAGDPVTPVPLLVAGAVGLVLVLNAVATVPGRSAYRLRAGEALRAE